MSSSQDRISLTDAIASLREEITAAQARAQSLEPDQRYRITEVDLELSVVLEDSAQATGEIGWWVLKASASGAQATTLSQKVHLKLDIGQVSVSSPRELG